MIDMHNLLKYVEDALISAPDENIPNSPISLKSDKEHIVEIPLISPHSTLLDVDESPKPPPGFYANTSSTNATINTNPFLQDETMDKNLENTSSELLKQLMTTNQLLLQENISLQKQVNETVNALILTLKSIQWNMCLTKTNANENVETDILAPFKDILKKYNVLGKTEEYCANAVAPIDMNALFNKKPLISNDSYQTNYANEALRQSNIKSFNNIITNYVNSNNSLTSSTVNNNSTSNFAFNPFKIKPQKQNLITSNFANIFMENRKPEENLLINQDNSVSQTIQKTGINSIDKSNNFSFMSTNSYSMNDKQSSFDESTNPYFKKPSPFWQQQSESKINPENPFKTSLDPFASYCSQSELTTENKDYAVNNNLSSDNRYSLSNSNNINSSSVFQHHFSIANTSVRKSVSDLSNCNENYLPSNCGIPAQKCGGNISQGDTSMISFLNLCQDKSEHLHTPSNTTKIESLSEKLNSNSFCTNLSKSITELLKADITNTNDTNNYNDLSNVNRNVRDQSISMSKVAPLIPQNGINFKIPTEKLELKENKADQAYSDLIYESIDLLDKTMYIFHYEEEGYLSTDEFVKCFTSFNSPIEMLDQLDVYNVKIPFKILKRPDNPLIFSVLDNTTLCARRDDSGNKVLMIHLTPLKSVIRILRILKITNNEELNIVFKEKQISNDSILYQVRRLISAYGRLKSNLTLPVDANEL